MIIVLFIIDYYRSNIAFLLFCPVVLKGKVGWDVFGVWTVNISLFTLKSSYNMKLHVVPEYLNYIRDYCIKFFKNFSFKSLNVRCIMMDW